MPASNPSAVDIGILEFGTTLDINDGSVQMGYTSAMFAASSDFEFQGHPQFQRSVSERSDYSLYH